MTDNAPEKDFGSLVEFRGGEATTTSFDIANGVDYSHKTVIVDDKARPRAYVTPKGLEYLADRVPEHIKLQSAA